MNVEPNSSDLIFTIATAKGRAAITTVIIHGVGALRCLNQLFRPIGQKKLGQQQFGKIVYGHWTSGGMRGEDLIVCPKAHDWCEVHCHGGKSASAIISRSLMQSGAVETSQIAMATRLSGNELMAHVQLALSKTKTDRTARIVLNQTKVQPQFWERVSKLAKSKNDNRECRSLIDEFLIWKKFGSRLSTEWTAVLCGSPNVGKSSLINSILGYQRAIVHEQAGTTRDSVKALTAIDGWPVRLVDTAGIHATVDPIEKQGIELAQKSIRTADLVVLIIDSADCAPESISQQIEKIEPDLVVANKSDLATLKCPEVDILVSAKTNIGVPDLIHRMAELLVPEQPSPDQAFPVSEFQVEYARKLRNDVGKTC